VSVGPVNCLLAFARSSAKRGMAAGQQPTGRLPLMASGWQAVELQARENTWLKEKRRQVGQAGRLSPPHVGRLCLCVFGWFLDRGKLYGFLYP
jgi:hypothetical protein